MERRQMVKWVIERVVEILAEADECRKAGDQETGERLANIAGGLLASMYTPFALDEEFVNDLEGVRGSVEATKKWLLSSEVTKLHGAYDNWARQEERTFWPGKPTGAPRRM